MHRFVNLFPVWVVLFSSIAFVYPPAMGWYRLSWIGPMLGGIMLGMGLTLTWDDFARVGRAPKPILIGVAAQFVLMPTLGYLAGLAFGLGPALATGLILVACCPGGTASNVIAYLARADVALSVSMTSLSTLVAVLATPLLTAALAGSQVAVDPLDLLAGTLKVVLVPVVAGVALRAWLPGVTRRILPFAPPLAVAFILLIVAAMVGGMKQKILAGGTLPVVAVACVHLGGASLGYLIGRWATRHESVARTVSIEVGMQNAGLGIALASGGSFVDPLVALPSVSSAVISCLLGSALAAFWSRRPIVGVEACSEPASRAPAAT